MSHEATWLESKHNPSRHFLSFPGGLEAKVSACKAGDLGSIPGSGRSRRRKWQPTPVFFPGESHGWRTLPGYSLWGRRELDTSEATERVHRQPEDALVRTVCEPEGKDISSAQLTTCHTPCFVTYKGLCSWQ